MNKPLGTGQVIYEGSLQRLAEQARLIVAFLSSRMICDFIVASRNFLYENHGLVRKSPWV